jgi:hypothetical protein
MEVFGFSSLLRVVGATVFLLFTLLSIFVALAYGAKMLFRKDVSGPGANSGSRDRGYGIPLSFRERCVSLFVCLHPNLLI